MESRAGGYGEGRRGLLIRRPGRIETVYRRQEPQVASEAVVEWWGSVLYAASSTRAAVSTVEPSQRRWPPLGAEDEADALFRCSRSESGGVWFEDGTKPFSQVLEVRPLACERGRIYEAPPRPDECACQPGNLLDAHASRDKQAPGVRAGCKSEGWTNPRRRWHGDAMPGFIMRRCREPRQANAAGPTALSAGWDILLFASVSLGSAAPHESAVGDAGAATSM